MEKVTTSERLKYYMKANNIKQTDILKKAIPYCKKYNIKLGKNDLSQYVSGKVEPGQKKLTVISKALDINPVWLMGYDVPMNLNSNKSKSDLLKERIDKLNDSQKEAIINIIDNMK